MKIKLFSFVGLLVMGSTVMAQHPNSAQNHALRNPNSPNYIDPNQQPSAPPVRWATRWGAIAESEGTPVIGAVTNFPSKGKAKKAAIKECENRGGSNCKLLTAYYNQCAVVVTGDRGYGAFTSATIERATENGMRSCQARNATNCHVYYSGCSMPVRIQ